MLPIALISKFFRSTTSSLTAQLWATSILVSVCVSCVVSTNEGVGSAPNVPLKPQLVSDAAVVAPNGLYKVGARHILISYTGAMRAAAYVTRSKTEAAVLAEKLRQEALEGADFGLLAEENSDDRGSAASQGSLGTFTREQMVPAFSNAAFSLEIDDISAVVESPFGFHVIQRIE